MDKKSDKKDKENRQITGFEVAFLTDKDKSFVKSRGYEILLERAYEKQRKEIE